MEPYKKCTNFPVNTLRAINHQLIYAKVLILASSTLNKNRTYIYFLGGNYSYPLNYESKCKCKGTKIIWDKQIK